MSEMEISSPKVRAIETYWDGLKKGRAMPSRADIDPGDIPDLLSNIILIDVLRDPDNLRYRLVGTEIEAHSALDPITGKLITDLPDRAPPSKVWDNLWNVARSGAPSRTSVPYLGPKRDFISTQQIVLPLSEDGRQVNMLMVLVDYISGPARRG